MCISIIINFNDIENLLIFKVILFVKNYLVSTGSFQKIKIPVETYLSAISHKVVLLVTFKILNSLRFSEKCFDKVSD